MRVIVPPGRYTKNNYVSLVLNATMVPSDQEQTTFEEAISCPEAKSWIEAMSVEMQSLSVNETWSLAPFPKGRKPIASKWIYKLKEGVSSDKKPRYKARLVAKDFT